MSYLMRCCLGGIALIVVGGVVDSPVIIIVGLIVLILPLCTIPWQLYIAPRLPPSRRARAGWSSDVLHGIGSAMDRGLDRRRLMALADFIEGLEMMPQWGCVLPQQEQVGNVRHVDGRIACLGYVLRPGGAGYGNVLFDSERKSDPPRGYYLSGYGLVCWAWGAAAGMNAVAGVDHVNKLQDVLTAEPVQRGEVPALCLVEVTTEHVADALRHFIETEEEPAQAWLMADRLWNQRMHQMQAIIAAQ